MQAWIHTYMHGALELLFKHSLAPRRLEAEGGADHLIALPSLLWWDFFSPDASTLLLDFVEDEQTHYYPIFSFAGRIHDERHQPTPPPPLRHDRLRFEMVLEPTGGIMFRSWTAPDEWAPEQVFPYLRM